MNTPAILRITVLLFSAAAMALGILVTVGLWSPPNVPERFRVMIGIVLFLYGSYRFVVAYFRSRS